MPTKNKIPSPFFNASSTGIEKARKLRQRQTPAEEKLWPYLRNGRFWNLKFRRQHPIDRFIVDFICMEEKLVIEVDGEIHNNPKQKEHDIHRTKALESYGLKVIRFSNDEIMKDVFKVLSKIKEHI